MKEELLDDNIQAGEESYLYLEELQQFPALLSKVALVLGGYVALDVFRISKSLMTATYQISFLNTAFELIINGVLAFLVHAIWLQKTTQEEAHKRGFEENEQAFLVRSYNIWYLLGLVMLVLVIRTIVIFLF